MGSVGQRQHPARQGATLASTAPNLAARYTIPAASALDYQVTISAYNQNSHSGYQGLVGWYGGLGGYGWYGGGMAGWWNPWWYGAYRWLADPEEPALDPGFWNLRGAVDKVLAAGSQYAGGYDSHPFELLDTAWLPIVPAQLPNADASSSATPSAPNEPGSSLSGLAFGVLNAALGSGVALTVATTALGGASEAPAESSTRAWNQDEVLHRLGLIDEGNQSDSKPLLNFWRRYGSIAPAGWKRWLWFRPHQAPVVPILPENSNGNIDLGAIKPAWSSAPSIYAIQVPNDWDSEKVAAYVYGVITDSDHPSRWCRAFEEYLASEIDGVNTKEFERLMKSVKTQILRKAGQNAELYLKLAVGVAPGGSGVLALNALSKGDYAEAALEVFFLIPWLRFAGGRLNHITIVARNGDEVIVSRQAVEAWQQVVYNGGEAGLKRAEDLGQALKAGGRNADEVVGALRRAGINASANRWGRGLIGIVQPGGTVDSTLRAHYLDIARSPQMAAAIERYNWIARFLRQKPSAGVDDIVKALGNDVTFSRVGHVRSGVFVPGRQGMVVPTTECWFVPATNFWIQGNPTTLYGRRVGRHELVHLGAALRGQGETWRHEVAVQLATTPENLVAFVGGVFIVVGGQAYWLYFP